jgi:epoxide hydrolase-like predicted phosphatase
VIKAVIFDVGGVLVRTPDRNRRRSWENQLGLSEWESEEIVFGGEMGTKAQLGQIGDDALWTWVGQRLGLNHDNLAAFRHDFWAGDILDSSLIEYIRRLRPYRQTAVISNATDKLRHTLDETYAIADAFDLIVCSAEEKIMKPDHEIYRRTLDRLDRRPEETVFIDDTLANVQAARQLGMKALHFFPSMDVPVELGKLGIRKEES